jgi:hypothetical protein
MPCIPFRGGIVCTYSTEYALLPVQECGWCLERRRMLIEVKASGYMVDVTCLGCGTIWRDGGIDHTPRYDAQYRDDVVAKAKGRIAEYRKHGLLGKKAERRAMKQWKEYSRKER